MCDETLTSWRDRGGRLVKDKTTGLAKLTCRNWESGVVLAAEAPDPAPHQAEATQTSVEGPQMLDMFRNTVPVPMQLPGSGYDASRHPWFFRG